MPKTAAAQPRARAIIIRASTASHCQKRTPRPYRSYHFVADSPYRLEEPIIAFQVRFVEQYVLGDRRRVLQERTLRTIPIPRRGSPVDRESLSPP